MYRTLTQSSSLWQYPESPYIRMCQSDIEENDSMDRTVTQSSSLWQYPQSPHISIRCSRSTSLSNQRASQCMSACCLPVFARRTEDSALSTVCDTLGEPYAIHGLSSRRGSDMDNASPRLIDCLNTVVGVQCEKNVVDSSENRPNYMPWDSREDNNVAQMEHVSCINAYTPVGSSTTMCKKPTRLILNIGGVIFETLEETLAVHPDTLLGNPDRRLKYLNERTGEIVFHRRFASFDAILFFYQSNGILAKPQTVDQLTFERELEFFEIPIKKSIYAPHNQCELVRPRRRWSYSRSTVRALRRLFHSPFSSPLSSMIAILNIMVTTLLVIEFCLSTLPRFRRLLPCDPVTILLHRGQSKGLAVVEVACMLFLNVDFIIRLLLSQKRLKFLASHLSIIDAITMFAYYASLLLGHLHPRSRQRDYSHLLRQIRILQMFRLSRYSCGFRSLLQTAFGSMLHLGSFILIVPIMSLCFAAMMYFFEEDSHVLNTRCSSDCRQLTSFSDWFWYSIITITTVGYGDVYPRTIFGKMVGTTCALFGVVLFCLLTPIIFRQFVEHYYIPRLKSKAVDAKGRKLAETMKDMYYEDQH